MPKIDIDQKTLDFATHAIALENKKNLDEREVTTLNLIYQTVAIRVIDAIREDKILNKK